MKKGFLLGIGCSAIILALLLTTGFTNATKETCIHFKYLNSNTLYKDCGNYIKTISDINIDSYDVNGAYKFPAVNKNDIILVPTAPRVKLKAKKDDQIIAQHEFKVRLVPRPFIVIKDSSNEKLDLFRGIKANSHNLIKLDTECSAWSFKQNHPKDARFSVSRFEAILARGEKLLNKKIINGDSFNLKELGEQKPLDRIIIRVNSVVRKNFQDKIFPMKLDQNIFNIPIN